MRSLVVDAFCERPCAVAILALDEVRDGDVDHFVAELVGEVRDRFPSHVEDVWGGLVEPVPVDPDGLLRGRARLNGQREGTLYWVFGIGRRHLNTVLVNMI